MKKAIITTRVIKDPNLDVWRDCLDEKYTNYFAGLGFVPVLMPNFEDLKNTEEFVKEVNPDLIIFSGGNNIDPQEYGGNESDVSDLAPIRDKNERRVLDIAIEKGIVTLGVCRGMQMINVCFGGALHRIVDSSVKHVASTHKITHLYSDESLDIKEGDEVIINSYHNYGITPGDLAKDLSCLSVSEDGLVELYKHKSLPIMGMLWHPERDGSDEMFDKKLLNNFLNNEVCL